MKNFETIKPTEFYALIRAGSEGSALETYYEEVGIENADVVKFQEVTDEYVMQQHRNLDDSQFADGEMEAVLEEARKVLNDDDLVGQGIIMLIDGNLI